MEVVERVHLLSHADLTAALKQSLDLCCVVWHSRLGLRGMTVLRMVLLFHVVHDSLHVSQTLVGDSPSGNLLLTSYLLWGV